MNNVELSGHLAKWAQAVRERVADAKVDGTLTVQLGDDGRRLDVEVRVGTAYSRKNFPTHAIPDPDVVAQWAIWVWEDVRSVNEAFSRARVRAEELTIAGVRSPLEMVAELVARVGDLARVAGPRGGGETAITNCAVAVAADALRLAASPTGREMGARDGR